MGSYVISVSQRTGCYRHIKISSAATLHALHKAIIAAFEFDDDHPDKVKSQFISELFNSKHFDLSQVVS